MADFPLSVSCATVPWLLVPLELGSVSSQRISEVETSTIRGSKSYFVSHELEFRAMGVPI